VRFDGELAGNGIFLDEYRDHAVPLDFLLDKDAIYVHAGSPELKNLGVWREPVVR